MAEFKTGVWRYFNAFNAFKDAQMCSGNETIQCRPWVSTDGITRNNIYIDMLAYIANYYYYSDNHSIKYTQLYSGLTVIPSSEVLSNYNINNYSDVSPLTYTNTEVYSWDEDNEVMVNNITVSMTNSTSSAISINSLLFRKHIAMVKSGGAGSRTSYANALMMAYYFDEPLVVLPNSTETYTVTIKTK